MNKGDKKEVKKNPFAEMEEDVIKFWEEADTFKKSVEKGDKDYVFYDGPPFITGLPHYATLLPSIAKDMIPRYWTMKGYKVERVWGWDCHGLPAENKVEKELELRNKQDIEKLGVGKFVDACRNYVQEGSEQWEWYINRIARWVDMKNSYRTMDKNYMESVMWAFKTLHDKGLIYEGYRTSLHCPRCATPLSKFEITMDAGSYKDVEDESVVVKFKVKNQENTFILAWTTTPWTLPGNLALAVGGNIEYVKIEKKDEGAGELLRFILANDLLEKYFEGQEYKIIEKIKGEDLVGSEYEPVFDLGNKKITDNKKTFKVYVADFVTTEDGTGIVHIAPNFGEDDFNLGKVVGLPMIDLMDENGIYTEEAGNWQGEYFKKANIRALKDLGDKKFSANKHTHSYPFCYRCNTRLIHKTQKAWYLRIEDIRKKMLKNNKKKINWVPEYFKEGRFQNNLKSAPDWCLSRSRYWGSPLPVWRCEKCGEIKVTGSIEEIEKLSGKKVDDLHRPQIDGHVFECEKCKGEMKRVKEVLDCWFESGSMPFAQFHYPFENKKEWKDLFPSDFIIEYTGQLRGWFYYLHVLANALFDDVAFKNVIVSGVLAGTDGRKMSKSYGNYPDPKNTLHKYGADALRLYFMNSSIMLGDDTSLSEKDIQDALRKNIMILWNVTRFYDMFNDGAVIQKSDLKVEKNDNILDQWIVSRLNQLIEEVTDKIEKYDLPGASRPITPFIDDLSTWYLRRSRDRFKSGDEKDKAQAIEVMGFVLNTFSKVLAPVMPFIAEQVWQKVNGFNFKDKDRSVHLEEWPKSGKVDKKILEEMIATRKTVEIALAKRDEVGIKVRQPLQKIIVCSPKTVAIRNPYIELIKADVNIKEVEFHGTGDEIEVELDTEINDDLKREGMKREFVRFINAMRKKAGLTIEDSIAIFWDGSDVVRTVIKEYRESIIAETLAEEVKEGVGDEADVKRTVDVNGEEVQLGICKK